MAFLLARGDQVERSQLNLHRKNEIHLKRCRKVSMGIRKPPSPRAFLRSRGTNTTRERPRKDKSSTVPPPRRAFVCGTVPPRRASSQVNVSRDCWEVVKFLTSDLEGGKNLAGVVSPPKLNLRTKRWI